MSIGPSHKIIAEEPKSSKAHRDVTQDNSNTNNLYQTPAKIKQIYNSGFNSPNSDFSTQKVQSFSSIWSKNKGKIGANDKIKCDFELHHDIVSGMINFDSLTKH